MPLSERTKEFHTLGPCDVKKGGEETWMKVNVVRQTSHTGEQFHFEIPVYASDTREEMNKRIGMCLSVIQDRLEEENEAFLEIQQGEQKKRLTQEAKKRNTLKFESEKKQLRKQAKKEGWTQEVLDEKIADVTERYEAAMKTLDDGNQTIEEIVAAAPKNKAEGITGTATDATH